MICDAETSEVVLNTDAFPSRFFLFIKQTNKKKQNKKQKKPRTTYILKKQEMQWNTSVTQACVSGFTREDADEIPISQKSTCFFNSALKLINSEVIGQTIVQYITMSQFHLFKGFEGLEEQNCRTIAKSNIKIQARDFMSVPFLQPTIALCVLKTQQNRRECRIAICSCLVY